MPKHKQSKRERKFNAKGGVKARLDKGHTIAPKGKVKRKRRTGDHKEDGAANNKRKQSKLDKYTQQQEAQRASDDFVGRANLGEMDISSFLANLEEDLKNHDESSSDEDSVLDNMKSDSDDEEEVADKKANNKQLKKKQESDSEEDSSSSSEEEDKAKTSQAAKKKEKATPKSKKKKTKEASDSDSDSEDSVSSSSSSEEEEKPTKKPTKSSSKQAKKKGMEERSSSNDDDSDSEDEDIEAVEARMKAEMKKLQSQDPEFHEYLQENEQSLLEFGADEHDDDSSDGSSEEDEQPKMKSRKEEEEDEKENKEEDGSSIELTPKMLGNLEHGAFKAFGIKSLKKLVRAYKSACQLAAHANEDDDNDNDNESKKQLQAKSFRIESSQVFDSLMVSCLGQCHEAFYFHLLATDEEREASKEAASKKSKKTKTEEVKKPNKSTIDTDKPENDQEDDKEDTDDDKPLDPKVLERSPRWMDVKPILHTFLKATQQLITESKEPDLLAIVLKSMSKYLRYMTPFPRMAESLLRTLVGLWSAPLGDASPDYQVVRLNAFLRIRQLALTQPFPFIELCLKKTYLAYARRAKYGGTGSIMTNALPTLTFMGNCLVELYSLDHQSAYQHAFVYIRQLALFLRAVLQKKTTEAFQQVYCWQYMHCLKLWAAVLSATCKQARAEGTNDEQLMRSLVYPLTEIILGTVRMAPAPSRHVPLRFHCVRLLQQLAASSELFIPTTTLLLETLDLKELGMKPKKIKSKGGGATTRGVQLPFLIKLSKDDPLRTAEEQEACMAEIFKLLNREADLYRFSAGFPEYAMKITQRLKKFIKATKNSRWRAYARGTLDLCQRHTDFAIDARSRIAEAPKDVKQLECLRQAKDPSMSERYDAAVEKENKEWTSLIAASTATPEKKKARKEAAEDEEDSESEAEEEEVVEKPKKEPKKGKKHKEAPKKAPPKPKADDAVMDIEDTVQEGVDWSDDED